MNSMVTAMWLTILVSFSLQAQQNQDAAKNAAQAQLQPLPAEQVNPKNAGEPLNAMPETQTQKTGTQITTRNGVVVIEDTIRVSREQPKVLSIVPWQPPRDKASLPSPFIKRIEQNFRPLERGEFTRQVQHFERLSGAEKKQ